MELGKASEGPASVQSLDSAGQGIGAGGVNNTIVKNRDCMVNAFVSTLKNDHHRSGSGEHTVRGGSFEGLQIPVGVS